MKYSEIDKEEIECEGFVWDKPIFAVRMKDGQVHIFDLGKRREKK